MQEAIYIASALLVDDNEDEETYAPKHQTDATQLEDLLQKAYSSPANNVLVRLLDLKRSGAKTMLKDLAARLHVSLLDCEIQGIRDQTRLLVKGRLYAPDHKHLRLSLIQLAHDSRVGSHRGWSATYNFLSRSYYWPGMLHKVNRFVRSYHTCKRIKYSRSKYQGFLHPLPIPERPWNDIFIDFVTPLPLCEREGHTYRHIL